MGKINRPRHGSMAFRPRKRAISQTPFIRHWPEVTEAGLVGFAGYKAGMTQVMMVDDAVGSSTKGQEISIPVTVIEVPPLHIFGIRAYHATPYGDKSLGDVLDAKIDAEIKKELMLPKETDSESMKKIESATISDVRILAYTNPQLCGFGSKGHEVLEIAVGGKDAKAKLEFAKTILGKDVPASEFAKEGEFLDVLGVTKGKGWQGAVKRFHVSMQRHKSTNHYRHVGTLGPWHPAGVMYTVPMAGQTGYHKRTEVNKRVIKVGAAKDTISPAGGFPNYGVVKNEFVLVKGSVPGPAKRFIRLRKAIRARFKMGKPEVKFISLESKQG